MNKLAFEVNDFITETACDGCDGVCGECRVKEIKSIVEELGQQEIREENGCPFCRDKRGRARSFFVMDESNRTITDISFCPVCGSKMRV